MLLQKHYKHVNVAFLSHWEELPLSRLVNKCKNTCFFDLPQRGV